jgi:hypothetical protein
MQGGDGQKLRRIPAAKGDEPCDGMTDSAGFNPISLVIMGGVLIVVPS